ncbi:MULTISPECIES: LysR family transcriptional regulator [unclassified Burkholderia]|uniref:LysR family transcriptional regulator n=1 Tax=unclassified Burkholderia TaxID=2613784 RepID=UPI000F59B969|nr:MULTISPECIES: LysR family transcriptional regulator [unclassified Burkholderia]RQS49003.1 LysR family transcriptional regulator [Burkholderia sp. Bp8986]
MNFHLLKSFVTLANSLHFGSASQALNLSQPALTKQIKRLEDDLGAPLFRRDRHGTELTELGRYFLAEAQPLVDQAERVLSLGKRAARGEVGRLAIGYSFSTVETVSRVLPRFRERFPDVEVTLHDLSSAEQMERLLEGSLQAGFVRLPVRTGLAHRRLLSDRLALVVPRTLADTITGFDSPLLRTLPFLLLQRARAPGLHDHIARFCESRSFEPRFVQHANESLTIISLVGAGLGVSIMHESALHSPGDKVVCLPIPDADARWDVGLTWRDAVPDSIVENFVALLPEVDA